MGYHTEFDGKINITPPLNAKEVEYINKFNETRRMHRKNGAYFVGGTGMSGQGHDPDIIEFNRPDPSQPSLWCNIAASEDGTYLEWDGGEKAYEMEKLMFYIIAHFLGTCPVAKAASTHFDFLQGHILNGVLNAEGEEQGDVWQLIVRDNSVMTLEGSEVIEPPDEILKLS